MYLFSPMQKFPKRIYEKKYYGVEYKSSPHIEDSFKSRNIVQRKTESSQKEIWDNNFSRIDIYIHLTRKLICTFE